MTEKRQSVFMFRPELDLGPGQEIIHRLLRIGSALSSEKDLGKLLWLITSETRTLLSCDRATLYRIDHENEQLLFDTVDEEVLKEVRLPLNEKSIAGYVGLKGEVVQIEDVYDIPEDSPFQFAKAFDIQTGYRTCSMLVVPMLNHRGDTIGVLQLINRLQNGKIVPFKPSDRKVAVALAGQAAVGLENAQLYEEQAKFIDSFVRSMAAAVDARDPITAGHTRRVTMYTMALAHAYGKFTDAEMKELYYAAWLHDVGKIGVREIVLNKATRLPEGDIETIRNRIAAIKAVRERDLYLHLIDCYRQHSQPECETQEPPEQELLETGNQTLESDLEFLAAVNKKGFLPDNELERLVKLKEQVFSGARGEHFELVNAHEFENLAVRRGNLNEAERRDIESHVEHTFDILSQIPFPKEMMNVPRYAAMHHEKINGKGYPFGLSGDQVVVQGRILAIADIYDALTAKDRPYKPAVPTAKAIDIMWGMVKEGHLDGSLFQMFLDHHLHLLEEDTGDFDYQTQFQVPAARISQWEAQQAQSAAPAAPTPA